ncbi:hypothetical protein G7Y79_00046g082040 [Physcia stellaris]|nr:hypothetical protein G7Y79_00046g082040 [Physcia stellaris]
MSDNNSDPASCSEHDRTPTPLTDKEMRDCIHKTFNRDLIRDAAIDVLLSRMKMDGPESWSFYTLQSSISMLGDTTRRKIEDALEELCRTLLRHDIAVSQEQIIEDIGNRDILLHGYSDDACEYYSDFLNAANRISQFPNDAQSSIAAWPNKPQRDISLRRHAEVGLLEQISEAITGKKATATFAGSGAAPKQPNPSVDSHHHMVLYKMLEDMLREPGFLPKGAVLGVFCSHKYAHTDGTAQGRLPQGLKGIDRAVYSAFRDLNVEVEVLPILNIGGYGGTPLRDLRVTKESVDAQVSRKRFQLYQQRGNKDAPFRLSYLEYDRKHACHSCKEPIATDFDARLKQIKACRRLKFPSDGYSTDREVTALTHFQRMELLDEGGSDYGFDHALDRTVPHQNVHNVIWLNESNGNDERQFARIAYLNDETVEVSHSAAAIIAVVPKAADRLQLFSPKGDNAMTKQET